MKKFIHTILFAMGCFTFFLVFLVVLSNNAVATDFQKQSMQSMNQGLKAGTAFRNALAQQQVLKHQRELHQYRINQAKVSNERQRLELEILKLKLELTKKNNPVKNTVLQ